ncbi:MAG TPA: DUF3394 domain-containing protein, partial [Saliniramus sp.]|nr:DUF3394 domain-containing protein [Saliniramus sp.]
NTDLLLINVGWVGGISIFVIATAAMLVFAAATQGFLLVRSRLWESAALLLVSLMLLRPGFFMDQVIDPYDRIEPSQLFDVVAAQPDDALIRLAIAGPSIRDGSMQSRTMAFDLGPSGAPGEARFEEAADVPVELLDNQVVVNEPMNPGSFAGRTLQNLDFYDPENPVVLTAIEVQADQPPKQLFYIPALLLFGLVYLLHTRRLRVQTAAKTQARPA